MIDYGSISLALYEGETIFSEKDIIETKKHDKTEFVRGLVAHSGVIEGYVKIVKNSKQVEKVKKGDILVTQMTFPSFVPAMLRASAFVTDEGGITCHAAIVAREMKKPCIIGTKIATEVFKDGDKVQLGQPYVKGCVVLAKVLKETKGKKVTVFKKKRRKDYKKTQGHRASIRRLQ